MKDFLLDSISLIFFFFLCGVGAVVGTGIGLYILGYINRFL